MENEKIIANPKDNPEISSLSPALFKVHSDNTNIHDQAFETKPVSYLRDSLNRFAKNKASIVSAIIILIIALYAIIVPFASPKAHVDPITYPNGFQEPYMANVLPYNDWFKGTGFWDGTKTQTVGINALRRYQNDDSNHPQFVRIEKTVESKVTIGSVTKVNYSYVVRLDTYGFGVKRVQLDPSVYEEIAAYDTERAAKGESTIIKPSVDYESYVTSYIESIKNSDTNPGESILSTIENNLKTEYLNNANIYYQLKATYNGSYNTNSFEPVLDANEKVIPIYALDEDGSYAKPELVNGKYNVRLDYYDYFTFTRGFEPHFLFGSNGAGRDIFLRLAQGTLFSLGLGIIISIINFLIGLVWGALSGYYGGWVDLTMERITDIISNIPSIIILTICSIQFNNNPAVKEAIGEGGVIVLAFLIAFVYSGWVGVASTTRMQFYRFKGQEYVLASRTLGAHDGRLIFRHILPNAIGTLVTSSVLMIPSVIFSESTLSYLGIINFNTGNLSSIGTLLNEGQGTLESYPHILLFPCVIISVLMICFNLFGNGLRDAFNTSLKGADE